MYIHQHVIIFLFPLGSDFTHVKMQVVQTALLRNNEKAVPFCWLLRRLFIFLKWKI